MFEGINSTAVIESLEVLALVQECQDPHSASIVQRLLLNTAGGNPNTVAAQRTVGWSWMEFGQYCMEASERCGVLANPLALVKQSGPLVCPPPSELIDQGDASITHVDTVEVPVLGRVAAGTPILATENIESSVHVDRSLLPSSGDVFALSVQGDSMIEAGILDGDVVVARQQETANRGEIVVALIDDEATVKRFDPGPDCIRLLPENAAYDPIIVRGDEGVQFRIAGRVVGLMRRL